METQLLAEAQLGRVPMADLDDSKINFFSYSWTCNDSSWSTHPSVFSWLDASSQFSQEKKKAKKERVKGTQNKVKQNPKVPVVSAREVDNCCLIRRVENFCVVDAPPFGWTEQGEAFPFFFCGIFLEGAFTLEHTLLFNLKKHIEQGERKDLLNGVEFFVPLHVILQQQIRSIIH